MTSYLRHHGMLTGQSSRSGDHEDLLRRMPKISDETVTYTLSTRAIVLLCLSDQSRYLLSQQISPAWMPSSPHTNRMAISTTFFSNLSHFQLHHYIVPSLKRILILDSDQLILQSLESRLRPPSRRVRFAQSIIVLRLKPDSRLPSFLLR